ncbi:hypothetical protein KXD40_003417 [Peronospora effusa]|nr:hypothetical protein KXD40_003417 [Peronospora effusa]
MHLHFTTLCAAIAACRVSGSKAAPSRSIAKLPHPLPEMPNNRHLRSDKHALDEEERAGDIPLETGEIVVKAKTKLEEV